MGPETSSPTLKPPLLSLTLNPYPPSLLTFIFFIITIFCIILEVSVGHHLSSPDTPLPMLTAPFHSHSNIS